MKTNFHLVPSLFVGLASLLPSSLAITVLGAWTPPAAAASDDPHQILEATGVQGGLIVHLGCGDGRLTAALRSSEAYVVHGLDADPRNVEAARQTIQQAGLYGPVSVER